MMQDDSPTPKVPEHGMDVSTPAQADWPLKQVEELARELYIRKPFNPENKEACEALAQQAFNFLDNMREVCEHFLGARSEWRATQAEAKARAAATKHLPDIMPFEQAVRYVAGESRKDRALERFHKVLNYDARVVEFWPSPLVWPHMWPDTTVLPKLPAQKKRQVEAKLKKWRQKGVPRSEALALQSLFGRTYPLVVAEQNRAKPKRRGEKLPKVERRLQSKMVMMPAEEKLREKEANDLT